MPARVLILTASVGEGHDLPARTLAAQLQAEAPDTDVTVVDGLAVMGRFVQWMSEDSARIVFYRWQFLWDASFWFFARFRPTTLLSRTVLLRLGSARLLALVRSHGPDVVVSTYPQTTEVLGGLRRDGRLDVPVAAAITDLAAMRYWAAPGIDLHLVTHPESVPEVRDVAGRDARVEAVHGLTRAEFLEPRDRGVVRRELGLPGDGGVVLVSGGGWGVGDVGGAAATALGVRGVARVVCLCGRNDELRERMANRFAGESRVRVEGFTERIGDWMAAADMLVHSTGGLTVLEAIMRGCTPISYGWGRGHVRLNNAAYRRFGLAEVVDSRAELAEAISRALAEPREPDRSFAGLPSAASLVLALARERATA